MFFFFVSRCRCRYTNRGKYIIATFALKADKIVFVCFFSILFHRFFLHSRVQHIQMLIANINVTMIIFNRCYMIDKIWLSVVVVVRFYANLDILILW